MCFDQRQTDHRVITPGYRSDETTTLSLNSIGARFIHRFARSNIVADILL